MDINGFTRLVLAVGNASYGFVQGWISVATSDNDRLTSFEINLFKDRQCEDDEGDCANVVGGFAPPGNKRTSLRISISLMVSRKRR